MNPPNHTSVLLNEIVEHTPLIEVKNVIDCTLGLGGHLHALLQKFCSQPTVLAFDQDETNLLEAKKRLETYSNKKFFVHDNFQNLLKYARKYNIKKADFILFDLGLSSPQVDNPEKGFSYNKDGPLDMRFNNNQKITAFDVVNSYSEKELIDIFNNYGEIKNAHRVAFAITKQREIKEIQTTLELVDAIKQIIKDTTQNKTITLAFQAIRIEVNNELEILKEVITDAIQLLSKGGRLAVISYHSLEDRIVKEIFKYFSADCHCDKTSPICICNFIPSLKLINRKVIIPSEKEIEENPRSRSAKLRIAEKI